MIGNLAYLTCGDDVIDIFNCLRVHTYLAEHSRTPNRHGCCPDIGPYLQACSTVTSVGIVFDDVAAPTEADVTLPLGITTPVNVYTNPQVDAPWWYKAGRPESAGFWGFEAVRVGGLNQSTTVRDHQVSALPCGGISYGRVRNEGIELVVEGILHGATCCAVAYGYRALMQQFQNCNTGCGGTTLRYLSTIPDTNPLDCSLTYDLPAETTSPWRSIHNITMVEYPSIVGKEGLSCGGCGCAPATWVRFVLRGNPGLFLDPINMLSASVPHGLSCTVFCEDPCEVEEPNPDPLCPLPILPEPPTAASSCYCPPVAMNRVCYSGVSSPNTMFDFQVGLEIYAGSIKALRNIRIRVWREIAGLPYDPAVYTYCNTDADIGISYVPVNGTWDLLPGEGVFVTVGGVRSPSRQSLFTGNGQPRPPCVKLPPGNYVICVDADVLNTGSDATFQLFLVEMEPT